MYDIIELYGLHREFRSARVSPLSRPCLSKIFDGDAFPLGGVQQCGSAGKSLTTEVGGTIDGGRFLVVWVKWKHCCGIYIVSIPFYTLLLHITNKTALFKAIDLCTSNLDICNPLQVVF